MVRALFIAAVLALVCSSPALAATRRIEVGPATLVVPSGWRSLGQTDTSAVFATAPGSRVVLAFGPVADRSLVPPALRDRVRGGAARPALLGGHRAWRYGDVTVLPSTAGVLAIACADCAASVTSASIPGATLLEPAPDLAFRIRLPQVLAALDRARVRDRGELERAASPGGQAHEAHELAAAYAAAAATLRPLGAPPELVARLEDAGGAYVALAAAARSSAPRYASARAEVQGAETRLAAVVDRVARSARLHAAVDPARPMAGKRSVAALVLVVVVVVVAAGLVGGALWRRRRRPQEPSEPVAPEPPGGAPPPPSAPDSGAWAIPRS